MKQFFGSLFGSYPAPKVPPVIAKASPPIIAHSEPTEFYKKGDVIGGKYEVHGTLGKGGFGVVYLVYDRDLREVCALKTFRDELLADAAAREAFKKEALLWVNLEEHPFILAARWVTEIFGRLFVRMDYVPPDDTGAGKPGRPSGAGGRPLGRRPDAEVGSSVLSGYGTRPSTRH